VDKSSAPTPDSKPDQSRLARPRQKTITLDTLLAELANPAWHLTASHLRALAGMGQTELAKLAPTWTELSSERRRAVTLEVLEIAEDNIDLDFGPFYEYCLGDADDTVRALVAASSEVDQGWRVGSRLLEMALADTSVDVRRAAATSLGQWVLAGETADHRPRWHSRLVDALLTIASNPTVQLALRCRALESASFAADERLSPLVRSFYVMSDATAKRAAVLSMGRTCDPIWVPVILVEMKSEEPALRFEAATAAFHVASRDTVSDLVLLTNDPDAEVREAAINALGEIGGPVAIRVLTELAATSSDEFKEIVVAALSAARENEDPLGLGELRPLPFPGFTAPPRPN
jgi:HEAT repeat protein